MKNQKPSGITELTLTIKKKEKVFFIKPKVPRYEYLLLDETGESIESFNTSDEAVAAAFGFYSAWQKFKCETYSSELHIYKN